MTSFISQSDPLAACTFYSTSEYPSADTDSGKFVRIKEDHPVGEEIFSIDVYPRSVLLFVRSNRE